MDYLAGILMLLIGKGILWDIQCAYKTVIFLLTIFIVQLFLSTRQLIMTFF